MSWNGTVCGVFACGDRFLVPRCVFEVKIFIWRKIFVFVRETKSRKNNIFKISDPEVPRNGTYIGVFACGNHFLVSRCVFEGKIFILRKIIVFVKETKSRKKIFKKFLTRKCLEMGLFVAFVLVVTIFRYLEVYLKAKSFFDADRAWHANGIFWPSLKIRENLFFRVIY